MRCWCVSGWAFPTRRFAPAVVLFAGLATVTGIRASSATETNRGCHLQAGHTPAIHVGALLVVASPISKTAITAMQAEVERIWRRYGVKIRWLAAGHLPPGSSANVDVLVVVDSRGWGRMRPTRRNTLGCFGFDRDGDSRPLIRIFPRHAQRLAGAMSARICGRRCLEGWLERLHGTLLGRALAHEMGHYLLGTEHSPAGLMRAQFHPREVLEGEPKAVSLTDSQLQRLTSRRVDRQPAAMEPTRLTRDRLGNSNGSSWLARGGPWRKAKSAKHAKHAVEARPASRKEHRHERHTYELDRPDRRVARAIRAQRGRFARRLEQTVVDVVRQATARFQGVDEAIADGYAPFQGCVSGPEEGAMGVHYVKSSLFDGVIDAAAPEALVYEPRNGRLRLVAIEYITPAAAWHGSHPVGVQPDLMGHLFHFAPGRIATAQTPSTSCTFGHGSTIQRARLPIGTPGCRVPLTRPRQSTGRVTRDALSRPRVYLASALRHDDARRCLISKG